jgi:hypothetical protein
MTWTAERRAAQAARCKAWHAACDPERARARAAVEQGAREIAQARLLGNPKPPLVNPFWRALVELIIARTISGESLSYMSLCVALGVHRNRVFCAARALIRRGFLARNKKRLDDMGELTALADADGNAWQRDGALIRLEIRDGQTIKVCPPRHAAGALIWPQKLQRRGA